MYLKSYFTVLVLVFHINSGVAQFFANHPPYDDTPLSIPVAIIYDKPVVTLKPYKKPKVTTYRPEYSVVTEVSPPNLETSVEENLKLPTGEVNTNDVEVKSNEAEVIQTEVTETEKAVVEKKAAVTRTEPSLMATEETEIATEETFLETEAGVTGIEAEVTVTGANFNHNETVFTETDILVDQTTKLPTYRRKYTPMKTNPPRKYIDISKLREERNKKLVYQRPIPKTISNDVYQIPVAVVYDDQDESRRNYQNRPLQYKRTQRRRFKPKLVDNTENVIITEVRTELPQIVTTKEIETQNLETSEFKKTKIINDPSAIIFNKESAFESKTSSAVNTKEPRTPLQLIPAVTKNLELSSFNNTRVMNTPIELTTSKESKQPTALVNNKTRLQRRRFKIKTGENTDDASRYYKGLTTVVYSEKGTGFPQLATIQESSGISTEVTNKPTKITIDKKYEQQDSKLSTAFVNTRVPNRPLQIKTVEESITPSTVVSNKTRTLRRRFKVKKIGNPNNAQTYSKTTVNSDTTTEIPQIVTTQESTTQNSEMFTPVVSRKLNKEFVGQTTEPSTDFIKTRVLKRPLQLTTVQEPEPQSAFVNTKTRTQIRRVKAKTAANTDALRYSKTVVNTEIRTEPTKTLTTQEYPSEAFTSAVNTKVTNKPSEIKIDNVLKTSELAFDFMKTIESKRLAEITPFVGTKVRTQRRRFKVKTAENTDALRYPKTFESVATRTEPPQTLTTLELTTQRLETAEVFNTIVTNGTPQIITATEPDNQNTGTFTPSKTSKTLPATYTTESAVMNAEITSRPQQRTAKESSPQNSRTFTSFENTRISSRVPQRTNKESALPNTIFFTATNSRVRSKSSVESTPRSSGTFTPVVNTRPRSRPEKITAKETVTVVPKVFPKRTYDYIKEPEVPIVNSESYVFSDSGNFHYRYEGADGTKAFERGELKEYNNDLTGEAVVGGFSYKDKDGNDFSVSYTADENGYRPIGAHLPTPPPIPPAIAKALAYLATKTTDSDSTTESLFV